MADGFDLEQFKETSPPPSEGFDLDKYKEASVPTEAEAAANPPVAPTQAMGGPLPNTRATRRDAQAQPTVTPAARAADPTNQRIMQGIEGFGTAAGLALPGLEVAEGGTLGWPIVKKVATAIAKPAARSMIGATAGGYGGREIGGLVGHPEAGEKIGAIAGGLYGGMGGTVPTKAGILKSVLSNGEEAPIIATPNAPTPELPARVSHVPSEPIMSPNEPAPVAGPLSNRQIGSRIEQGVKEAAGTTPVQPGKPIYTRPVQGTVGAKTVAEMPNTEVAGPPIATPSRNQTLTNYAGENVEKAAARTPMTPRNENAFYKDFSPRERQDIHTNMEVRTPDGYEAIPNAENHWERLSKTPEVREDLFKMENDQVREALRKSGLTDMQNKTVKSSDWTFQGKGGKPFRDPNVIPRAKALGMMMDNGVSDEDIIKWGGGEETRSKVYRARTTAGPSREGLAAGPADRGYPEK